MKKLLLTLLVAVMSVTAWAAADYTLNPTAGSNSSYTGNCDVTVNGITWNVTGNSQMIPWRIGGKSISNVDRTVYSKTAYSSAVSKVDLTVGAASSITVNSLKLVYSTNSDFSNSSEISKTFAANSTISFEGDFPKNAYYKFVFNVTVSVTSNKFVEFSKVEFYNAEDGAATLTSLTVSGTPTKTVYTERDAFDPAGLTVTGTFSDDSQNTVDNVDWEVTPSTLTAGTTSVSVVAKKGTVSSSAYVVNGLTVNAIPEKTIAEFIAAEGGKCYLTGTVSNIQNTTYGNFDLTDESGTIYVYGCLTSEGVARQFASLDVVAGDKIKVLAEEYELFGEKHEAKNVIFVEEIEVPKDQYTVSIETPENGTLVVKEGENVLTSGDQVEEGKTLTVECTPAAGYRYQNWQYKEDGNWVTMTSTMTRVVTQDISIRANFELIPTYTIAFSVNGSIVKSDVLQEGAAVTAPADPEAINGKVFTGWVTTESVAADATPAYVTPATTATATVTYYAVFATATDGGESQTNDITYETENIPESYASSTDVVLNGMTFNVTQMYKNGAKMQWRAAGNSAGTGTLYNKTAIDGIQSIQITYDASDTNKNFTIKVGNTENPKNGTEITPETNDKIYTFDCSAINPSYFVLTNGSGAGYLKEILITYGGGTTYSDFTTTVVTSTNLTIGATGYATFFDAVHAYTMPDDCEGYVFTVSNGLELAYEAEEVVPAGEPLVIYTIEPGTKTLNYTTSTEDTYKSGDMNDLCGAATDMTADEMAAANTGKSKFYALSLNAAKEISSVGFYWHAENGGTFAIAAGKAYLALSDAEAGENRGWSFSEMENGHQTAISELNKEAVSNVMYDLQGRRANGKGLMIQNGKVVLVK